MQNLLKLQQNQKNKWSYEKIMFFNFKLRFGEFMEIGMSVETV
jgi:hypothetical protein